MARTTVNLDPTVLRDLKRRARDEGKSLGEVISEIVGPALTQGNQAPEAGSFPWRTALMGPPNVDLEDKEAVRRALEGR